MNIEIIKSARQYDAYLRELSKLIEKDPSSDSPVGRRAKLLSLVIGEYEDRNFTLHKLPPNPVEAIKFRMEQQGLEQKDLIPYIGTRARVSEILSGKRRLSMAMIRRLHLGLGIPIASLIELEDAPAKKARKSA